MARYRTEDGALVDTDKAQQRWAEATDWDGSNHIGRSTGSQWRSHTLHLSAKGRFYLESESRIQGERSNAEFISHQEAARWLLHNGYELPAALEGMESEVCE